jgi:hypothetical protein
MASFCLVTKLTPTEYRQLTLRERQAFMDAFHDLHSKDAG